MSKCLSTVTTCFPFKFGKTKKVVLVDLLVDNDKPVYNDHSWDPKIVAVVWNYLYAITSGLRLSSSTGTLKVLHYKFEIFRFFKWNFYSNQKKISAETTCPFLAGRARHVGQSRLWSRRESAVDCNRGGSSGAQESTFTPSSPSGGGCCSCSGDAKLEQPIRIEKCSGGFYRKSGHKVQQAFNTI